MKVLQCDYDFAITDIKHVLHRGPNPSWSLPLHINQSHHVLALSERGKAHYRLPDRTFTVDTGDMLFLYQNTPYETCSDAADPWVYYSIAFDLQFFNEDTRQFFQSLDAHLPAAQVMRMRSAALFPLLYRTWTLKTPGYRIKCRSLLMDILYELILCCHYSGLDLTNMRRIEQVTDFIRHNGRQTHSVIKLAQLVGLSPSYLRLLFKKYTGYSVCEYQNMLRINRARDLLENGECNVTEAARQLGFEDVCYFSRLYKKKMGTLPSQHKLGQKAAETPLTP